MELSTLILYFILFVFLPLVIYLIVSNRLHAVIIGVLEALKTIIMYSLIRGDIKRYKEKYTKLVKDIGVKFETDIHILKEEDSETQSFYGIDQDGNSLLIKVSLAKNGLASVSIQLTVDNNIYILPGKTATIQTNLPKSQWRVGGLNIEVVEPFKKLRIAFNGLLSNAYNDKEQIEHIQFNFIFIAACSPYFPQNINDSILGKYLLKEKIKNVVRSSNINNKNDQIELTQFGVLTGLVRIESSKEMTLVLTTCRKKYEGTDSKYIHNIVGNIIAVDECGNTFNIGIKQFKDSTSKLIYGFAYLTASDKRFPIASIDINGLFNEENKNWPDSFQFEIKVGGNIYEFNAVLNKEEHQKAHNRNGYKFYNLIVKYNNNLNKGIAVIDLWESSKDTNIFIPEKRLIEKIVDVLPDVLVSDINDEYSQILELTGGKGCSLALLASLKSTEFTVPDGFIITVNAFKKYVEKNDVLKDSISLLDNICCGRKEGKLEDACKRTIDCFKNQQIPKDLQDVIITQLKKYTQEDNSPGWAVRSSAIGEDSEEFSAAGQNETFLGCQSQQNILQSIQACWASLYTYQSVQYRWQHGLPVTTNMAVVVQKMIKADCAGVLFTCHPSTSNPSQIVITSNFGLGETVVSGDADPDTFILKRTFANEIKVDSKVLGTKNKILTITASGLEDVAQKNSADLSSLTDEQAIELGRIGILLEKLFGNPRDIEWGFQNNALYLFQSRPITTLTGWTDYELAHEMDYPILTRYTVCTTANIREVMPKAMSVLTRSSVLRGLDWAIQKFIQQNFDPVTVKGLFTYQHNLFLDVVKTIYVYVNKEIDVSSLAVDLAIFGHGVLDEKLNNINIKLKGLSSPSHKLEGMFRSIKTAWQSKEILTLSQEVVNKLNFEAKTMEGLYNKIDVGLADIETMSLCHSKITGTSVFYQMLTINILLEGRQEISEETMADFALILSSCEDVVSVEVPKYLEGIAAILKESEFTNQFRNVNPDDGVAWLKNNCFKAYELFMEFMQKHGHRGRGEFDVMENSWSDDPSTIISMIQANLGAERREKVKLDIDDIITSLKTPKKAVTRKIVKFFLKKIRVAVGMREQTKSLLVLSIDKLRKAYRRLGEEMVLNALLPSKDLIFHLTHEEVGSVIKCRNPLLISKALRRQKLYSTWRKLKFPELMFGIPEPEKDLDNEIVELKDVCRGTPVYRGSVRGRACVIRNLDEISQLKPGDILITYSTDIGWSPYFPMLSGVVTELGGLVSHGAVVAREYGLPCIVGVRNVLKYFKTGDIVLLNGDTGELGKA